MIDFNKLKEPFPSHEVKWRVAQCGISAKGTPWAQILAYIDARAVMDRLDFVVGEDCWQNKYESINGHKCCGIGIKIGSEWVWKFDGSGDTQIEAEKGGFSDSFKRAAVHWGIARYLYKLPAMWAECTTEPNREWNKARTKNKETIYWKTPDVQLGE